LKKAEDEFVLTFSLFSRSLFAIAEKVGAFCGIGLSSHLGIILCAAAQLTHGRGSHLIAVVFSSLADVHIDYAMRGNDINSRIDDILVAEKVGIVGQLFQLFVVFQTTGLLYG